jgi:hypothetical protein
MMGNFFDVLIIRLGVYFPIWAPINYITEICSIYALGVWGRNLHSAIVMAIADKPEGPFSI